MKHWTEEQFKAQVLDLATRHDWLIHHDRPAMTSKGWRTAIEGTAGFPDLCMVNVKQRPARLIMAELKSEDGKMTADQALWRGALRMVEGIETYLWKPSQLEEIADLLGPRPEDR